MTETDTPFQPLNHRPQWGIYGGTFDPIHTGHLILVREAAHQAGLEKVLVIPAAQNPFKSDDQSSSAEVRFAMTELALEGDDLLDACDVEIQRTGPSYTIDTVRELQAKFPEVDWYLLVGGDILEHLNDWREAEELLNMVRLVVLNRVDQRTEEPSEAGALSLGLEAVYVDRRLDISSTEIRERVQQGKSIRYWVPERVEQFIHDQRLYRG
ncbi:MAG: nicotinate-nucleotide adenylyltransferase [Verrucomicrobiales bacterium]